MLRNIKFGYFHKHYRLYSNKINLSNTKTSTSLRPAEDNFDKVYENYKHAILYSSYIESTKLHLGYKKRYLLNKILKKQSQQLAAENARVKPLPMALKYLSNADDNIENVDKSLETQININAKNLELLKNVNRSDPHQTVDNENEIKQWMSDYECFNETDNIQSEFGTPDPTIPVSKVPCYGCGSLLQCADSSLPGYLPSELFRGQKESVLRTITCQRCHFLKNYNTAINVTVSSDDYIKMISQIEDKFALAILMIDLTDFPCSIWPDITSILGKKRPIFIVGNKVDLLPQDSKGHLEHVKNSLIHAVDQAGISQTNIRHTCLISAQTGYGIEELITKLHNEWRYKGDVYLIGCTNVGKSSLFNALLRSDYCKVKASSIIQKATASPWPGTTLRLLKFPILRPNDWRLYVRTKRIMSERAKLAAERRLRKDQAIESGKIKHATLIGHIGRTFSEEKEELNDSFSMAQNGPNQVFAINEESKDYAQSKWCFDTPGVVQPEQVLNLLTTEELLLTIPKQMIKPRTYIFKPKMTLFLAGLGRLDFIEGSDATITVYAAATLPVLIVKSEVANEVYSALLGSSFLAVPAGDSERLKKWPTLKSADLITVTGGGTNVSCCDLVLSSAGWIGFNIPLDEIGTFKAYTPDAKGIYLRNPSLIPYGVQLRGSKIKGTLAFRNEKAFITD